MGGGGASSMTSQSNNYYASLSSISDNISAYGYSYFNNMLVLFTINCFGRIIRPELSCFCRKYFWRYCSSIVTQIVIRVSPKVTIIALYVIVVSRICLPLLLFMPNKPFNHHVVLPVTVIDVLDKHKNCQM